MKIQSIAGAVMSAGVCGALVCGVIGCNAKPVKVVDVDQSVLSPAAKALLPQDASITKVQEETYGEGNTNQVITYTLNGVEKKIKISSKDHTSPSGVFEEHVVKKEK